MSHSRLRKLLFCFDGYSSLFTSVKERNVIKELQRVESPAACFCSVSQPPRRFSSIRADGASDAR